VGPLDAVLDLAARATHVMFSEPGLAQASGTADPGEGLARIAGSVHGILGVTLGPEGVLWRQGDRERRIPAPRTVAVDTLAAGDVWHGAFTLALAEKMDVAAAARFANAAAAIKCTRTGGRRGAPNRAEVLAQLRQYH
jgi:sulfofructose kinase